ncbi:MAG: M13 family peptidase [Gammaproteobacteria bacterium]|nr:MAG: M13 family peptidase [Gammaproteobacteria bacterium]
MRLVGLSLFLALFSGCQEADSTASSEPDATGTLVVFKEAVENVDLSLMDPAVAPGDDFYAYANGAWLSSFELPPDKSTFGNFYALYEQAQDRVQGLIEELAAGTPEQDSIEQKIGDYYASFLDTETLDRLGFEPIRADLARIRSLSARSELAEVLSWAVRSGGSAPLALGIQIDRKDPSRFIGGVFASGLGLPERDYYLEDTERFETIRQAYLAHITEMLTLVEAAELAALAESVLALETAIAEAHWPRADRRNRDLTYNISNPDGVMADFPGFDWAAFFEGAGATPEVINVAHPSAIPPIIELIADTPLTVWRAYLAYHLVSNNAPYLATHIDQANFEFYGKVLRGQPEQRERWRRAVSLVSGSSGLGDAIGEVYVARYFPAESKAMMQELVENMRDALSERVDELDWMGDETKARAQEKLEAFLPKIGYPNEWRDYSDVEIDRGDLMGNVRSLRDYYQAVAVRRLSEPTDRNEWFSPPQTVNAFYNAQYNTITFPAGILEPPFFNPKADPAVNYGAIGAVIGHEMGHGFDDQGSKSNGAGVQENWWTDEDRARFETRAEGLAEQYSAYEAVPGTFIDGRFTLGENIGDLGGINIAYHAYRASLEGEEAPIVDGLTGDQRFFLAFAQIWRAKAREETVVARLKSAPHSPEIYRVNGVVRNVDAWYDAFDVDEKAALYLSPEARVRIW